MKKLPLNLCGIFAAFALLLFFEQAGAQCNTFFTFEKNDSLRTLRFFNTSDTTNYKGFYWDFGDGNTSVDKNPLHTYANEGRYYVRLSRTDSVCTDSAAVFVDVFKGSCKIDYSYTLDPVTGEAVFTNLSYDGPDSIYTWFFNDGESLSFQRHATHFFQWPDTFEVCLKRDSWNGCINTVCKPIIVTLDSCVARFSYHVADPYKREVRLHNFTTASGGNYLWYFGDGDSSAVTSPVHIYNQSGSYRICLFKTDTLCPDSVCKQVELYDPQPCMASFTWSVDSQDAKRIHFTNTSSGPGLLYHWNAGTGNISSNAKDFSHTYPSDNFYLVCLTVTTADSTCADSSCVRIMVYSEQVACRASFTYTLLPDTTTGGVRSIAAFQNTSAGNNNVLAWDFGNGQTSADSIPVYDFKQPGVYPVCLFIYDSLNGCSDAKCDTITIEERPVTGLNRMGDELYNVEAYPVPVTDVLKIRFTARTGKPVRIKITGVTGIRRYDELWQTTRGTNELSLPLEQLSQGIYFMELSTAEGTVMKRIIK